jgi:hypothetical protein
MSACNKFINRHRQSEKTFRKLKMRTHLNADAMIAAIRKDFDKVPDHRARNAKIPLADVLMSCFAMFSLKDTSLLDFDKRREGEPESLHSVYGIGIIPCDSQMRTILDETAVEYLRRSFRTVFHQLQRGKMLPRMTYLNGHLILAIDGTSYYSSEEISSDYCLTKKKRNGVIEYHMQMLAGAFVHPDQREVIPVCPEIIRKQDGSTKNDCERNAAKRFLDDFRREHPHLKVIVVEDGLSSNAPHILELQRHDLRYILGAKPDDHVFLFTTVDEADQEGRVTHFVIADQKDPNKTHWFRFINQVPLNKASQDELLVNFLEYKEITCDEEGTKAPKVTKTFSWVTDLEITKENVWEIMRGGRVRWRIENETFNTLKNQGYNLDHNYGMGKKHLSSVFVTMMMLAFLVDQVQQMCCPLFQAARKEMGCKRLLWERIRGYFHRYMSLPSMEVILRLIVYGAEKQEVPDIS